MDLEEKECLRSVLLAKVYLRGAVVFKTSVIPENWQEVFEGLLCLKLNEIPLS